jgi:hypothetical protein
MAVRLTASQNPCFMGLDDTVDHPKLGGNYTYHLP